MCAKRRSSQIFKQIIDVIHESLRQKPKMRFLFLTLTVRNVPGNDLSEMITQMFQGFKQLFKYKEVDKPTIGYIRALEVTYNKKDKTFHPHIHVLIGVMPSYFSDNYYIKQSRWTVLWSSALNIDYTPIVNIKPVKNKSGAIAETSKYTVKDADYIFPDEKLTDEVVEVLSSALKGRRLVGFGKLFKTVKRLLNLQDVESDKADLVGSNDTGCICPVCGSTLIEQLYRWNFGFKDYILDEEEYK
jgi:plasmid rolling circle replication initiator protein Rep